MSEIYQYHSQLAQINSITHIFYFHSSLMFAGKAALNLSSTLRVGQKPDWHQQTPMKIYDCIKFYCTAPDNREQCRYTSVKFFPLSRWS